MPFVFAVRTEMEAGLQGFDAIEVRSDQPIRSVQGIEILDGDQNRILERNFAVQGAPTEEEDAAIQELDERRFVVRFPQVRESGTVVMVRFVGRMLSFSNTFKGRVLLIEEEAFQDVLSGNAANLGADDAPGRSSVTVLSPQLTTGRLVRNLEVDPVVSPNEDGIRDRASISFEVVTIVGQAGINAAVFDLVGSAHKTAPSSSRNEWPVRSAAFWRLSLGWARRVGTASSTRRVRGPSRSPGRCAPPPALRE